MTYTKEQLIQALHDEWVHLCHDDYEPGDELYTSPEEHLEWLQGLTYEQLVEETGCDEKIYSLDEFMSHFGEVSK